MLFQAKFLLVLLLNTLPAEPEFNALVVVWSHTPDRLSAYSTRLVTHSTPLDSRLYQAMRMKTNIAHHP